MPKHVSPAIRRTLVRQLVVAFSLLPIVAATTSESMSLEEREVWAGEEAYWAYIAKRDVEGFMTPWDERFVGWPCGAPGTESYDKLRSVVTEWFADIAADGNDTTIEPKAVIVEEQFAVNYLAATTRRSNESGAAGIESIKIVHTWRRTDDGWRIIGGMCAALER